MCFLSLRVKLQTAVITVASWAALAKQRSKNRHSDDFLVWFEGLADETVSSREQKENWKKTSGTGLSFFSLKCCRYIRNKHKLHVCGAGCPLYLNTCKWFFLVYDECVYINVCVTLNVSSSFKKHCWNHSVAAWRKLLSPLFDLLLINSKEKKHHLWID